MIRLIRPIALAAVLILTLSAASSSDQFDVRYLLAVTGLGALGVFARYARERDRGLLRFENRVDGALWGPEDANGKRNVEAGLVFVSNRLAADLPRAVQAAELAARSAKEAAEAARECAVYAATAASAAKTAQTLLVERGDADRSDREERRGT
jgi:hypothetical protein